MSETNKPREIEVLKKLLSDGEYIAMYHTTCSFLNHYCIVPDMLLEHADILGCIEDTLHRLIDIGLSDVCIYSILGAEKPPEDEPDYDANEFIEIDLSYGIFGELIDITKVDI